MYSQQDGVIIIGNDPNEWFDNRDTIAAFIKEGSSSRLDIDIRNFVAYCEGSFA